MSTFRLSTQKQPSQLLVKRNASAIVINPPHTIMISDSAEGNEHETSLKEDVGNLEKWFNDQKIKILNRENEQNYLTEAKNQIMRKRLENENEKFKQCQEPIVNQTLVNFSMFDKGLENFLENEKNIEKMKEFARKNKKMYTFKEEDGPSAKKYEPIKSIDAIKNEFRKQILNQILVDKLIKRRKVDVNSLESLKDAKNLTIWHSMPFFKCLQKVSSENVQNLIEPEFLREKISAFEQKPKKIFEFGVYEAQFNKITNDLKSLEEILMEKLIEISNEVAKKKSLGTKLRNFHSHLSLTIKRFYDEKEVLLGKFNAVEQKLLSNLGEKAEILGKNNNREKRGNLTEFMRLEKFRGEKSDQEKKILKAIEKVQREVDENKIKLNELDEELKTLNFNKLNLKLYLREIYHKMLKTNDEALQENGLVWLVKAFWYINEELPVEIFPKTLDSDTIKFLKEYCRLELEISSQNEMLRQKQKEYTKSKLFKKYLKAGVQQNSFFQSNLNKSQMDSKILHLKKGFINTHKICLHRTFSEKLPHDLEASSSYYFIPACPSVDLNLKNQKTTVELEINSKSILGLQSRCEDLKQREIMRLILQHKERFPDDAEQLKERLICLFGKSETKVVLDQYSQKINRKVNSMPQSKINAIELVMERQEKKSTENTKINDKFDQLKRQIFNCNDLPSYKNSYIFFKSS